MVGDSERVGKRRYRIPDSASIVRDALSDVAEMLAPLRAAETAESTAFAQRLQAFAIPDSSDHELAGDTIQAITSGDRADRDSLHVLLMDMHRALNALQASFASETISGCRTYGVRDPDHALIAAFMDGINRTAPLKFDHPGLSATATRLGTNLCCRTISAPLTRMCW